MDTLAQIVHGGQVLFPRRVEDLQHDGFLEVPDHLLACEALLLLVSGGDLVEDALTQRLLVELVVRGQPAGNIEVDVELAFE